MSGPTSVVQSIRNWDGCRLRFWLAGSAVPHVDGTVDEPIDDDAETVIVNAEHGAETLIVLAYVVAIRPID